MPTGFSDHEPISICCPIFGPDSTLNKRRPIFRTVEDWNREFGPSRPYNSS